MHAAHEIVTDSTFPSQWRRLFGHRRSDQTCLVDGSHDHVQCISGCLVLASGRPAREWRSRSTKAIKRSEGGRARASSVVCYWLLPTVVLVCYDVSSIFCCKNARQGQDDWAVSTTSAHVTSRLRPSPVPSISCTMIRWGDRMVHLACGTFCDDLSHPGGRLERY
jgi:hypothetical protein